MEMKVWHEFGLAWACKVGTEFMVLWVYGLDTGWTLMAYGLGTKSGRCTQHHTMDYLSG